MEYQIPKFGVGAHPRVRQNSVPDACHKVNFWTKRPMHTPSQNPSMNYCHSRSFLLASWSHLCILEFFHTINLSLTRSTHLTYANWLTLKHAFHHTFLIHFFMSILPHCTLITSSIHLLFLQTPTNLLFFHSLFY